MNSSVTSDVRTYEAAPVYIVHTPKKDILNVDRLCVLADLENLARENGFDPYFPTASFDLMDACIGQRHPVSQLVERMHKRPLSSFKQFWFAGSGSSIFTREIMRYAFESNCQIVNCLPSDSMLYGVLQWYSEYAQKVQFQSTQVGLLEST